jgi:1-acyl-sn-glycerol-3-phosphate acyltransferase
LEVSILKKKSHSLVRKPNAILYYSAGFIAKNYYRLIYGHSVDNSILKDMKPPFLVVAGHSSWLDYMITTASMFPFRMNYVGAYNFFRSKILKNIFSIMGVIPKHQFTNDFGAVKRMKTVTNRGR